MSSSCTFSLTTLGPADIDIIIVETADSLDAVRLLFTFLMIYFDWADNRLESPDLDRVAVPGLLSTTAARLSSELVVRHSIARAYHLLKPDYRMAKG